MTDQSRTSAEVAFRDEGLKPETWSNEANYVYGEHQHPYHKVLFCIAGSITFRTPTGTIELGPGDRLDLPPHTPHSAAVGGSGVTCMEAPRN